MSMERKLTNEEIDAFVREYGWTADADRASITKTFPFATYGEGLRFVNDVAARAEARAHHPDMLLSYRVVTVTLTTHDAGGVTELDTGFAREIDSIASEYGTMHS